MQHYKLVDVMLGTGGNHVRVQCLPIVCMHSYDTGALQSLSYANVGGVFTISETRLGAMSCSDVSHELTH